MQEWWAALRFDAVVAVHLLVKGVDSVKTDIVREYQMIGVGQRKWPILVPEINSAGSCQAEAKLNRCKWHEFRQSVGNEGTGNPENALKDKRYFDVHRAGAPRLLFPTTQSTNLCG